MKRIKLTDLVPDDHNANRHSERGTYMVSNSLGKLGGGRGIVLDKNNKIVAGNLTVEQAVALGFEEVIVVESDGKVLVATERVDWDLDDPHGPARQYAYADNQAAAVSIDFDPAVIAADLEAGVELGDWFLDFELGLEPDDGEWGGAFGRLPDEDRAPFRQMTFTVHDDQHEQIEQALKAAKAAGPFVDSPNANSNGNALARICETYLTEHGQG